MFLRSMHAARSTLRARPEYAGGMFFEGFTLDEDGAVRMRRGGSGAAA